MNDRQPPDDSRGARRLSLRQMLQSVLAAAFGVQNDRNRTRDFSHGKPCHFVALGLLFTLGFVLLLYAAVRLVLRFSGAD